MADKILIVDDDPAIRKLLEKVMHSNEMETSAAGSGAEALQLLSQETYDLILMDVMLGDMEGFEVIKRLRAQGIKTPVMIVSGRNEDYDSLYGLSVGADDYITKPFRPVVLGAKVKALIRRNRDLILQKPDVLECGPFTYNYSTMRFYKGQEELVLSTREAALPMHQQRSRLNFKSPLRLSRAGRVTSRVFTSVTMGMGARIHSSKAAARSVWTGSISAVIFSSYSPMLSLILTDAKLFRILYNSRNLGGVLF